MDVLPARQAHEIETWLQFWLRLGSFHVGKGHSDWREAAFGRDYDNRHIVGRANSGEI